MNEQEKKELKQKEQEKNERRKIIATALDIAVKLTNADHTWLKQDNDGNVVMDEPLYSTVRLVMRAINDDLPLCCWQFLRRGWIACRLWRVARKEAGGQLRSLKLSVH